MLSSRATLHCNYRYGLTPEQVAEVDEQLAEIAAAFNPASTSAAAGAGSGAAAAGQAAAAGSGAGGSGQAATAADAGGAAGRGTGSAGGAAAAAPPRNALAISTGVLAATLLDASLGKHWLDPTFPPDPVYASLIASGLLSDYMPRTLG